jgi:hypothetical protein
VKLRRHTLTLVNWLPISALALGVLTAYVWLRAPQAKPLLSVVIWLVAGGFALYWLMRDRSETGFSKLRWLSFAAVLPLIQVIPVSYYLVRTRGMHSGLRAIAGLLALMLVFFLAYGGGIKLGDRIFA